MTLELHHTDIGYHHPLISNASASLDAGDIGLMIGNNSVGKTTLLKSILNQIPLLGGGIFINQQRVAGISPQQIAQEVAMVFSKAVIPEHYTTYDLIGLGKYIHYPYYIRLNQQDKNDIEHILEQLDLEDYRHTLLSNLSDGNLQKAFIGRALAQNSSLIILDEPTTHLDETNKLAILNLIKDIAKNQGKTVLFSSHDWRLARYFADKIWYLKDKQLYEGLVEDIVLQHNELITAPIISADSLCISHRISAPKLQEELLISFLQKHSQPHVSPLYFQYEKGGWHIKSDNHHFFAKDFSDIKHYLLSIDY